MSTPRRPRALSGAVLASLAALALALVPAAAAEAAGSAPADTAYIRVAHLVPGLGAVTMKAQLTSYSGKTESLTLAPSASYGAVSAYQALPVGYYSIALRPVGASPDSPAVLTGTLTATAGDAYTIAGLGAATAPRIGAIQDDIATPAAGTARVRVIAAAVPGQNTSVSIVGGPTVAKAAAFSQPTSYIDVPAGSVQMSATTGTATTRSAVQLSSGSVYTVLVLSNGSGGITLRPVVDATGAGVVPAGGAQTGAGGLAPRPTDLPLAAGGVTAAAAGAGGLLLLRRRAASARG